MSVAFSASWTLHPDFCPDDTWWTAFYRPWLTRQALVRPDPKMDFRCLFSLQISMSFKAIERWPLSIEISTGCPNSSAAQCRKIRYPVPPTRWEKKHRHFQIAMPWGFPKWTNDGQKSCAPSWCLLHQHHPGGVPEGTVTIFIHQIEINPLVITNIAMGIMGNGPFIEVYLLKMVIFHGYIK